MKINTKYTVKNVGVSFALLTIIISLCLYIDSVESGGSSNTHKPTLIAESEEEFDSLKNRSWSADELQLQTALFAEKNQQLSYTVGRSSDRLITVGGVQGEWIYRGPENVPGAWTTATIDVGTDTIYATTCGHYGGGQTIWRGTLQGDNFTMLKGSGRMPLRYRDINVVRKNDKKAILATVENGPLYLSTDDGDTWQKAAGLPDVLMNSVVDRQSGTVFTTDGKDLYRSTDLGKSFTKLLSLGSSKPSRIYTPLFSSQPGYGTLYVQYGQDFMKVDGSSLIKMGTLSGPSVENKSFSINGDTRRFYVSSFDSRYTNNTQKQVWWTSIDEGKTWTRKYPTGHYYSEVCEMSAGEQFGVSPTNPDNVIGGYAHPCASTDALNTVYENNEEWGWYQGGNDIPDQKEKLRKMYHPDFQSTHIWLDKNGDEFSLWCSDGGLFVSETAHLGSQVDQSSSQKRWRNLMLAGGSSVTETYLWGMVCGSKGEYDFALGVQDQGIQISRPDAGLVHGRVPVFLTVGGDGESCASGPDGLYGWSVLSDGLKRPFSLYNGATFNGSEGRGGSKYAIEVKDVWFDLKDYANSIWLLNSELHKITYNGGFSKKSHTFNNSGVVAALCQSPTNTNLYWVLDNNKVYKSTDGGNSFGGAVTVSMTASGNESRVRGWAFDDTTILFAGESENGVTSILSTDGGKTFEEIPGLPDFGVLWMQGDQDGTVAMASTRKGPYLFNLQQKKWFDAVGPQETGAPFFDGQWGAYIPSTNTFRFSTWGYGIWDFKLDDGTPSITVDPLNGTYSAADTLTLKWDSKNCSGNATISLLKGDSLIADLGQVDVVSGKFLWAISADQNTGKEYRLQVSNGSITKKSTQFSILPDLKLLNQNHIHVVSCDSEEGSETADKVLDGDLNTIWHTEWSSKQPNFPHEIVFAVDTTVQLGALTYQPRQDGSENGRVKGYKIYLSSDKSNWIEVASGELQNTGNESLVAFDTIMTMEYLKFEALSEVNGNYYASASEINLYYKEHKSVDLHIADNPAEKMGLQMVGKNRLVITIPSKDPYVLQVLTVNGRIIHTQSGVGSASIDLSRTGIAQGVYMVRLGSEKRNLVQKISIK